MRGLVMVAALAACVGLAGCETVPPEQLSLYETRPSQWSERDKVLVNGLDPQVLCDFHRNGGNRGGQFTAADFAAIENTLDTYFLSSRDVELLSRRGGTYGEGQSFSGLVCSLGYPRDVNRSFYGGSGHRWQAVYGEAPYSRYIYLEGDGSERGMIVTGWN